MTRREQAEWRRERLLDAALEVFAARGVDGASVKELAAAAGVAPGLLYHYFAGKEELVAALLAERGFLPRLRTVLAGAADLPAAEVLPRLLRDYAGVLADNAPLVRVFFGGRASPSLRGALDDLVAAGRDLLAGYLDARVRAGELRPHDTATVATALFASVALGSHTGGTGGTGGSVDTDALADAVLTGLVPRPADG